MRAGSGGEPYEPMATESGTTKNAVVRCGRTGWHTDFWSDRFRRGCSSTTCAAIVIASIPLTLRPLLRDRTRFEEPGSPRAVLNRRTASTDTRSRTRTHICTRSVRLDRVEPAWRKRDDSADRGSIDHRAPRKGAAVGRLLADGARATTCTGTGSSRAHSAIYDGEAVVRGRLLEAG